MVAIKCVSLVVSAIHGSASSLAQMPFNSRCFFALRVDGKLWWVGVVASFLCFSRFDWLRTCVFHFCACICFHVVRHVVAL